MRFFGWVIGLATVSAMLAPFVTDAERAAQFYTSGLNMIIGIAIGSLIAGVARSATRLVRVDTRPASSRPYPPQYR